MPLPLLLWGAAAAISAMGVKKGFDAKTDFAKAKRIGVKAEEKMKQAKYEIEEHRAELNNELENFAKFKLEIFTTDIKKLVETIKQCKKSAKSKIYIEDTEITAEEFKDLELSVENAMDLQIGVSTIAAGGLTGLGIYGSVGLLASASTGTAIATLSGAAATNATMAWLGGGALSAGGFGMAGGAIALGGIIAGPAIAVGGFLMAGKAEKAVTEAQKYSAKVDVAVGEIEKSRIIMDTISTRVVELQNTIYSLRNRLKAIYTTDCKNIKYYIIIGKALKNLLDVSILDEKGELNRNFKANVNSLKSVEV